MISRPIYQGSDWWKKLAFGMDDWELTNQHPAQEIWWEMLWEILWEFCRKYCGKFCRKLCGKFCRKFCGTVCWGKAYLRKAVIGGNLAFGMDDGELTNQHPTQEIWWDFSVGKLVGNVVGNSVGNSVGNAAGNSVGNATGNSVLNSAGDSVGDSMGEGAIGKSYLRKAVIGGNLAFGMGDGQLKNQHPAQDI